MKSGLKVKLILFIENSPQVSTYTAMKSGLKANIKKSIIIKMVKCLNLYRDEKRTESLRKHL